MKEKLNIPIEAFIYLDGLSGYKSSYLDKDALARALTIYRTRTLYNMVQEEFVGGEFVIEEGYILQDQGGNGHNGWDENWVKLREITVAEDRLWNDIEYLINKMEEIYD